MAGKLRSKATGAATLPLFIGGARLDGDASRTNALSLEAAVTVDLQAAKPAEGETPAAPAVARFTMVANNGNPMKLAGWKYPVVVDLEGLSIPSQSRPIRMNHDANQGVGHTDSISVQGGKLIASGMVSRETPAANDVTASAGKGFPWQASIGASSDSVEFVPEGKSASVNGKTFDGPVNVARKSTLGEISFVDLGADDQTSARVAAAKDGDPDPGDADNDPMAAAAAAMARAKAERARQHGIRALMEEAASRPGADIEAIESLGDDAMAELTSVRDFELDLLRATRPRFAIHAKASKANPRALEASLCLSGGCTEANVVKWYGGDTVQAARAGHPGASLSELFHSIIQSAGMHARPGRMSNDTIRAAFQADRTLRDAEPSSVRASDGVSTISLSGVLANVANKVLLQAYNSIPMVGPTICAQTDANDFKLQSRYRMTGVGIFEKVGPGGEIKQSSLTDETYTNQVDTYGKMVALTRQMIINDDLGAFLQIPRIMGRQSALAVEDAVFALLLLNTGSFFAAGNNNLISGATTNLQISSLTTAEQKFTDQTDTDGRPVLITPAYLLVPSGLKVTAQQLMTETRVIATGIPTGAVAITPANNPHAGKWEPLVSPFLNNANYTGNSSTAWYLIANPADVAFMELAYLRGQRTPTIESGTTDFDVLGMNWRGFFDFGVNFQDKRAAVKSAGA